MCSDRLTFFTQIFIRHSNNCIFESSQNIFQSVEKRIFLNASSVQQIRSGLQSQEIRKLLVFRSKWIINKSI